jgi:hypothetical protein
MYGFVDMTLVYCGECCVWFDRCVRVFRCDFNLEFLVEQWYRCGRVMEEAVNGLLLVMVVLLFVICCEGTSVK